MSEHLQVRGVEAAHKVCNDLKDRLDCAKAKLIEDHTGSSPSTRGADPKTGGRVRSKTRRSMSWSAGTYGLEEPEGTQQAAQDDPESPVTLPTPVRRVTRSRGKPQNTESEPSRMQPPETAVRLPWSQPIGMPCCQGTLYCRRNAKGSNKLGRCPTRRTTPRNRTARRTTFATTNPDPDILLYQTGCSEENLPQVER